MFTITIQRLEHKNDNIKRFPHVDTLYEAEILTLEYVEYYLGLVDTELVYIDDLDYYVYSGDVRIARVNIKPIYEKVRTKE